MEREIYSHQATKLNHYGNHFHVGGGEISKIFTLGHDVACVTICGCITSWELPCSLLKQTLALYFLFLYLHAFGSHIHSTPIPFPSLGKALL